MIAAHLKRARTLVAGGWVEPFSLDADGRCCGLHDEGLSLVSVQDALILVDAFPEGWDALESVVAPARAAWNQFEPSPAPTALDLQRARILARVVVGAVGLREWLETPGRTVGEVLRAFDVAILRAARAIH